MQANTGFRIGRIAGIEILINPTWLVVFLLVGITFGDVLMGTSVNEERFPGGPWPWIAGFLTASVFFSCLLAHELAHSLVAKRNGIFIYRITLFIFGGVAEMREDVGSPGVELKMALAGPAMTFIIALAFYLLYRLTDSAGAGPLVVAPLYFLAVINLFIGFFNLLPGFPLDGGRVLRALIWKKTGDLRHATRIASVSGQVVASIIAAAGGLMLFYSYWVSGVWFLLIGAFIFRLSRLSYRQTLLRLAAAGARVADIMYTGVPVIDPLLSLNFVRDHYFGLYHLPAFPVGDESGLVGYISREDLAGVSPAEWDVINAGRVARALTGEAAAAPDTPLDKVLRPLMGSPGFVLAVEGEEVKGILTREELLRYLNASLGVP